MKNLKNLAVAVVIIIMFSACSQKRTPNPMSPIIEEPTTVASNTETNTPTDTFTNTVTTDTPTETHTNIILLTSTFTSTSTSTATATNTNTINAPTHTYTSTNIIIPTNTSTNTNTEIPPTFTYTSTNTSTSTSTSLPTATSTSTGFVKITHTNFPTGIAKHKLAEINGYLLCIGGVTAFNGSTAYTWSTPRVYKTTDGNTWSTTGFTFKYPDATLATSKWTQRANVDTVTFNGELLAIGGTANDNVTGINQVWSTANGVDWVLRTENAFADGGIAKPIAFVYDNKVQVINMNQYARWESTDGINFSGPYTIGILGNMINSVDAVVNNGTVYVLGTDWNHVGHVYSTTDLTTWNNYGNQEIYSLEMDGVSAGVGYFISTSVSYNNQIVVAGRWILTDNGTSISESVPFNMFNAQCSSSVVWNGHIWVVGGFATDTATGNFVVEASF